MTAAAAGAAAAIAAARRRVIASLREQGAFSAGTACPLDLHRRLDQRVLGRLQRSGIVVADGGDRYYLNLVALDASDARRRVIKLWAIGGLTVAAGVGLLAALL